MPASKVGEDESVASFIRRRFGNETLERVGQPMIAGVYSGDPEELSILHTMPRFKELEASYGSVIRGLKKRVTNENDALRKASGPRYSLFLSFSGGMATLTNALSARLESDSLILASKVSSVQHEPLFKKWSVVLDGRDKIEADALCISASARAAATLLKDTAAALSEKLRQIHYESVATLNLVYRDASVPHARDGFGFVVPASEKRSLMACTFVDRKFEGRAPKGKALLRAFVGGAFGRRFFEMTDTELLRAVGQDLRDLLGINDAPLFSSLERYPETLPQYYVGHGELLRRIKAEADPFQGLFLTGSSYRGTGIPDCVHDAEREAERTVALLFGLKSNKNKSNLVERH